MYVKTKDWIYDTDNLHYRFIENNKVYEVGWDVEKPTFVADIIAQSENLEELCDEFVGYVGEEYVKENETYDMPNFQEYNLKDMLYQMSYNKEDCIVYGAIWTSKGLIYVAKMDSEGKLVLI